MRVFGRSRVPSSQGTEAARLLIAGDLDGALIAAEQAKTARNSLTRSEGYAVLAWVHLVRGERDEAEAAASVARRMRTRDPLLPVALVVAAGGPSAGAAVAFIQTQGVMSLVAVDARLRRPRQAGQRFGPRSRCCPRRWSRTH